MCIYGCGTTKTANQDAENRIDDKLGGTPLFLAIIKGEEATANIYISKKQYINKSRSDGVTPLILSTIKKIESLSINLILNGTDVNAVTKSRKYGTTVGMSALMFAAENGDYSLIKALISNKADVSLQDEKGMTALMYAVISKDLKAVMVLGEAGASYYHVANKNGHTATTIAKLMGLNEIFKYLQKKNSEALADQFLN